MKRELLKNGVCYTNTGYRALSFNSNLELSPVMYAVYSGYQPNRGTYQVKEEIVLEYRWGHGDPGTLYLNGKPIKEDNPIWKIIKEKYSFAVDFLKRHSRSGSFIPTEIIAESEYLTVKAKRRKIEKFLKRFGLDKYYKVESFLFCPKQDLRLVPRDLDFNPDKYLPRSKSASGSLVDIDQYERFFSSDGNGSCIELKVVPETESIDHAGGTTRYYTKGKPGIPSWKNKKYLIRVIHGAHTSTAYSHVSWGKEIDVWKVE